MAKDLLDDVDLEDLEKELESLGEEDLDLVDIDDQELEGAIEPQEPPKPAEESKKMIRTKPPAKKVVQAPEPKPDPVTTVSKATVPPATTSPFTMLQQAIEFRIAMIESGTVQVVGGDKAKEAVVENLKWVYEFISLLNR